MYLLIKKANVITIPTIIAPILIIVDDNMFGLPIRYIYVIIANEKLITVEAFLITPNLLYSVEYEIAKTIPPIAMAAI